MGKLCGEDDSVYTRWGTDRQRCRENGSESGGDRCCLVGLEGLLRRAQQGVRAVAKGSSGRKKKEADDFRKIYD